MYFSIYSLVTGLSGNFIIKNQKHQFNFNAFLYSLFDVLGPYKTFDVSMNLSMPASTALISSVNSEPHARYIFSNLIELKAYLKITQTHFFSYSHQGFIYRENLVSWHMQFISKFTRIGDAHNSNGRAVYR